MAENSSLNFFIHQAWDPYIYILISLVQEVNGTKVNNKNYDERGRFICKKLKISKDWSEKRNSDGDWRSPNLQPASKRGKNSVEKKVRQCAATLCNHAAQSITRQTVCLSTISLSLSYTQFFKRPSPVVPNSSPRSNWSPTKRSKVQPQPSLTKIYIYIRNIQPPRFNPSNENRLWTGFVAIPIVSNFSPSPSWDRFWIYRDDFVRIVWDVGGGGGLSRLDVIRWIVMGRTRLAAPSTLLSVIVQEKWGVCGKWKWPQRFLFFLDRRFTLRELEIRCNFIRYMGREE